MVEWSIQPSRHLRCPCSIQFPHISQFPVARELAPAGLRSSPKKPNAPPPETCGEWVGAASRPSGSNLWPQGFVHIVCDRENNRVIFHEIIRYKFHDPTRRARHTRGADPRPAQAQETHPGPTCAKNRAVGGVSVSGRTWPVAPDRGRFNRHQPSPRRAHHLLLQPAQTQGSGLGHPPQ